MINKYADKVRHGKTKKDRASGANERRATNRSLREEWMRDDPRSIVRVPFPRHACNGKKNRSRWTGKGNRTVII
jgi:hypothetical protein